MVEAKASDKMAAVAAAAAVQKRRPKVERKLAQVDSNDRS